MNNSVPSGYKVRQLNNFTPEQMNMFSSQTGKTAQGANSGLDYLNRLASGDESLFEEMEAPAHTQFNKFLGQAGSRYSQLGAQDSSGFQNAISGAGAEMSENMASRRQSMQQGAIQDLLSHSNSLLNAKPYDTFLEAPRDKGGGWQKLLGQLAPDLLKQLLPMLLGSFGGGR